MKQRRENSKKSIQRRHDPSTVDPTPFTPDRERWIDPGPLVPQNAEQERYFKAIKSAPIVFGVGPAGTGKSYLAAAWAAQALVNREFKQIILTRPAEACDEDLGFLPGELDEKYEPYIAPFRDSLNERLGPSQVKAMIKSERIRPLPLGFMRGMTFRDTIAILDEAQNTTPRQMKMFLSRIGPGSVLLINGDIDQIDIRGPSGLVDALENRVHRIPAARVVRLVKSVRHDLCQQVVDAYGPDV